MNCLPLCPSRANPLRAALAIALLSLSVGAAVSVPAREDPVEPAVFEQHFPVSEASAAPVASTADLTDNQISEALFLAGPEVIELLAMLAGIDPLQTP